MYMIVYQIKTNKKGEIFIMNESDMIFSMLYIKETFLHPAHTIFALVNQYPKIFKIIRREYLNLHFS